MNKQSTEVIKKTLNEDGVSFFEDEEGMELFFGVNGHNGKYFYKALVKPGTSRLGDIVVITSDFSEFVPVKIRHEMLEFINKVNSSSCVGNFQMDSDGTMSFHTSIHVPENQITCEIVRNLIYGNIIMMDNFLPLITNIIHKESDSQCDSIDEDIFSIFKSEMAVV